MSDYPAQYVVVRHRMRCCRQIDRQADSDLQRAVQQEAKMKRKDGRREEESVRQREGERERKGGRKSVCVCVRERERLCVCVREKETERKKRDSAL